MTEPAVPAVPDAPASGIATVAAAPDPTIDPRTGEPRRPWSVRAAAVLLYLGVATLVAGLLWTWWLSVTAWTDAAPLHRWVADAVGELTRGQVAWLRAGLAAGEFALTVLVGAAALVAGYYGWRGHRWTRWAGLLAAGLAAASLLLHPVAWACVPLVALGAVGLWLPPTRRYFERWHALRHPEPHYPTIAGSVAYGPLPRYRSV